MSGYGPFDDFTLVAMAISIILSAIISLIGSSARRLKVVQGGASVQDLCELTGITDPKELQTIFGPPAMGRIWNTVSLREIRAARRPLGWLISGDPIDWACIAIALISFFYSHVLLSGAVLFALVLQASGWAAVFRLPK